MDRPMVGGADLERGTPAERADTHTKERILASSPFGGLAGSSRAALLALGTVEPLLRKVQVAQQGEAARSVLVVGAGRVKLERVDGARRFPVGHRGPGEIVGDAALGGVPVAMETAIVLDEGEALALPVAGVCRLLATDAEVRAAAIAVLSQRRLDVEGRLASLLQRPVEARLIELLLAAARRWGRPHPAGELVSAPFTHADIAQLIGSTRETVTLLLGRMKRAGLITFDRRRVVLCDAAALARRVATT